MDQTNLPATEPEKTFTRREVLNYAWLASLGILTVNIAGASVYFSLPRSADGEFGGVIKLGPIASLPASNTAPLNHPEGNFWLAHTETGVAALYKVCPHLDCLFTWNAPEDKFICPCHGSQFDWEGVRLSGPAPRSLDRFVIQLVSPDGEVLAETDPQTGALLPLPALADVTDAAGITLAVSSVTPAIEAGPDTLIQVDTGRKIKGDRLPEPVAAGRA